MYLTNDFIARYNDIQVPFGGNGMGAFIYLRTYSRWIPEKNRREEWIETCQRVVEYSMSLYQGPATEEQLREEAEFMFDQLYHLRVFPAGRTLWIGGSEAAKKFGSANFNCAFVVMDKVSAITDLFHLLMVGAGVGFRILTDDVDKLPRFNTTIVVAHKPYNGKAKDDRREDTVMFEESDNDKASVHIVIGDSKGGWVEALNQYLTAMQRNDVESIIFNYDSVRPAGEILKTFGGRASGHQALKRMFRNIHKTIRNSVGGELIPINVLDICNHIGYNVVVGGVRRTSEIALFDQHDSDVLNAKIGLWNTESANYGNDQRSMSNNSIFFTEKPAREILIDIFHRIQDNGEPGFVNAEAASKRRPNFKGLNPCAEILLDDRGVCNLTEVNLMAFVREDCSIMHQELYNAIQLAVRIGLRQTNITFDLPEWDAVQKRDRLTGVSLDGVMDFLDKQAEFDLHPAHDGPLHAFFEDLSIIANDEAQKYAKEMRVPEPLLVTTEKPSGTLSKLPGISSGIHRARAPYFIRRVRITSSDPLARVMLDAGYPIYPENNSAGPTATEFDTMAVYEKWEVLQKSATWVIEFPQKSPTVIGIDDESATDQFKRYLLFQDVWTDHNTSITINFAPNEVEQLVDMILDNWDNYIAVAFLPKNTNAYPLLPEEPITEEEYNKRAAAIQGINAEYITKLLREYEHVDLSTEVLDPACDNGVCPIR